MEERLCERETCTVWTGNVEFYDDGVFNLAGNIGTCWFADGGYSYLDGFKPTYHICDPNSPIGLRLTAYYSAWGWISDSWIRIADYMDEEE
jgi:hypothetical protein